MPRIPAVFPQTPTGSTNPAALTGGRSLPAQSIPGRGPAQPREQFPNRQANRVQSASRQATRPSTASDDAAANVIRGVSFTANVARSLPHYLGASWSSYRVENVVGAFARFMATRNASTDGSTITVTSDATVTADIRVW